MLALGVVLQAGETNERLFPTHFLSWFDSFYQVSATANLYDLAK
jgi:hypothetical protein